MDIHFHIPGWLAFLSGPFLVLGLAFVALWSFLRFLASGDR